MAERKRRRHKDAGRNGTGPAEADRILLKALSHPVRARALTVLGQRVASPSELAAEQGEPVGDVAYHVRVLRELEMIELVKTRQVRGATEHFYRSTAPRKAGGAGASDSPTGRHLSNVSLDLDEEAWRDANTLLNDCLEGLLRIGSESAARRGRTTVRATFGLMGFESPA